MARHQKSRQKVEGGGLGFFKQNLQGVNFWKCDKGDHDIDIIPYIAGPNDPDVDEGTPTYVLEVYEHRNVGDIEGQTFICLEKTFGRPCPICEYRKKLTKSTNADEDVIKSLRPSGYPRTIYNVVVYDSSKEEEKGVQVWHTSYYLMGQHLDKLAQSSAREIEQGAPKLKMIADQEDGYSIKFTREGTGFNTKFIGHQLIPRKYEIEQELLDQAYQLDDLIHIPTYDEVYAAFWNEATEEQADEPPKQASGTKSARSSRGAAKSAMGSAKATGKRSTRKQKEDPEQGFGPEDELPESLKAPSGTGEIVCPAGGEYGQDAYELEECEDCEHWEACTDLNQKLLAEQTIEDGEEGIAEEEPPKTRRSGRGGSTIAKGNGANGRGRRTASEKSSGRVRRAKVEDMPPARTRAAGRVTRGAKPTGRGRGRNLVR